ncbi:ATP-binding protein [Microcoleus vaginatus PCC 9802]|uniref:TniB family NTP-binding protein n=1 Tax=Microcoleus vaginatus TaxID=119532 RepID=UPI00020D16D8|nr:AAA ATPase [Microcoleus vaginatus FGP-2]UNU21372.1 ATP-binding protein [Microcoleus vaginatus PCC 9802]
MNSRTLPRARGVILTPTGQQKLQAEIHRLGIRSQKNAVSKIVEKIQLELKDETLGSDTVRKIVHGEGVQKSSLELVFRALRLKLEEGDCDFAPKNQLQNAEDSETSSFVTGTPITHPHHFFGRQKELKRLFDLLKRRPLQNAAIIGKRRSGKTSLLQYLKNITTTPTEQLRPGQKSDWLPHPENYRWIFVDFQDPRLQSREGLLRYILECLKMSVPNPCDLERFMDVVSSNLRQRTVILLDEIGVGLQGCPELDDRFWESLRSLATNQTNGNLGFILATPESPIELARSTGHSSPFFNIFGYTATLAALTEAEARELIASSPTPFPAEDIEWILTQSKCWPLLLQILCRERLFSLEHGEMGDDWQEEGLQQMQPFTHLLEKLV